MPKTIGPRGGRGVYFHEGLKICFLVERIIEVVKLGDGARKKLLREKCEDGEQVDPRRDW
jgi:hypothetical protein